MSDETVEPVLIQVSEKLNKESIKLWLSPYLSEDDIPVSTVLQELSVSIGKSLNLNPDKVYPVLLTLQSRAINKLKERKNFIATGIADLRVRISGNSSRVLNEKISLSNSAEELLNQVAEEINLEPSKIKLISKGHVLDKNKSLTDQGVKNGALLMALVLSEDTNEVQNAVNRQKDLQNTFADIDLITNGSCPIDSNVQIADQSGKNLTLPKEEKKALVTAMVLHEKGRAALDKKDYARALVFLLEADNRFNLCTSSLLNSVDNYAVLNLDIAWCYLCLGSVTQLPEGKERLRKCEMYFHKSYGPNLERLMTIKGSTGNEQALFMRLHLLQGIVAYHQGNLAESRQVLDRAEAELKGFRIDDSSLSTLLELGYSEKEARFGLRGAYGNMERAVHLINKRRDEEAEANEKNKVEKLNRALGYCADGKQYVRSDHVATLTEMGFVRSLAVEALRETNNQLSSAMQLIQEQPEILSSRSISRTAMPSSSQESELSPELIEQVSALGFDTRMAAYALKKNEFNVQKTVEELMGCNGILDGVNLNEISQQLPEPLNIEESEALARITDEIKDSASKDYYDLDFEAEESFLVKYQSLLHTNQ